VGDSVETYRKAKGGDREYFAGSVEFLSLFSKILAKLERLGHCLDEIAESDEENDVKVYPDFVFLKG